MLKWTCSWAENLLLRFWAFPHLRRGIMPECCRSGIDLSCFDIYYFELWREASAVAIQVCMGFCEASLCNERIILISVELLRHILMLILILLVIMSYIIDV